MNERIRKPSGDKLNSDQKRELKRHLSLLDAFLARSDYDKAEQVLMKLQSKYSQSKEVIRREKMIQRYQEELAEVSADPNDPIPRENLLREQKQIRLEKLLQKVQDWQKDQTSEGV